MHPYKLVQPYKRYFQKSAAFLFPALHIRRSEPVQPLQTYVSWRGRISAGEQKLVVLYDRAQTRRFPRFVKETLLEHPLLDGVFRCEENGDVYVFSFRHMTADWAMYLQGRYSQLSLDLKRDIRNHFGASSNEYAYIDSYLYPTRYYDNYAELLEVDRQVLEARGELIDAYDPTREELQLAVTGTRTIKKWFSGRF